MSWFGQVGGSLTSLTGQLSNLTKDILTETINEVEDTESELIVAQRNINELESTISVQQAELSKLKILNEELQLKAECAELQLQTLNEKYRATLADNEKANIALLSFGYAIQRGEPEGAANDLVRGGHAHGMLKHSRQHITYHPDEDLYHDDDLDFASEALTLGSITSSKSERLILRKVHDEIQNKNVAIEPHSVDHVVDKDFLHKLEEYHREELASLQDAHNAALSEQRRKGAQKISVLKEELSQLSQQKIELEQRLHKSHIIIGQHPSESPQLNCASSISLETQTNGSSQEESVQLISTILDISKNDVDHLIDMLMNFRNRCSPDYWLNVLGDLLSAESNYCSNCNASSNVRGLPMLHLRSAAALDDSTSQISDLSMVSITSRALEDQVRLLQGRIAAYESVSAESNIGKGDVDAIQQELLSLCGMLQEKRKKRRGRTNRRATAQQGMSPAVLEASVDEWEVGEDRRDDGCVGGTSVSLSKQLQEVVESQSKESVEELGEMEHQKTAAAAADNDVLYKLLEERTELLKKVEVLLMDVGSRAGWLQEMLCAEGQGDVLGMLQYLCEKSLQSIVELQTAEHALKVARFVLLGGDSDFVEDEVRKVDVAWNIVQLRRQFSSELTESREAVAALDEENSSLQSLLGVMKDEASHVSRQRERETEEATTKLQAQLQRTVEEHQLALGRVAALEHELERCHVAAQREKNDAADAETLRSQVLQLEKRIEEVMEERRSLLSRRSVDAATATVGRGVVVDAATAAVGHGFGIDAATATAGSGVVIDTMASFITEMHATACSNCSNADAEVDRLRRELLELRNAPCQSRLEEEDVLDNVASKKASLPQENDSLTPLNSSCLRCEREAQLTQQLRLEKEQIVTVLNDKSRECSQLKSEIARLMQISVAEHAALDKLQIDNQRLKESQLLSPPPGKVSSEEEEEMTREALRHLSSLVRDKENEIEALKNRNESLVALVKMADATSSGQSSGNMGAGFEQLLASNQALQSQLTAYQQDREQIVAALNQKHTESLTYHAELQRVIAALQKERHAVSTLQRQVEVGNRQLEERSFALAQSSEDLVRALQRCTELSSASERREAEFESECNLLHSQLNEFRKEVASMSSQQAHLHREEQLNRELERLRQHLMAVEVAYTEDALTAEKREKELRDRLASLDDSCVTQAMKSKLELLEKELSAAKISAKQSAAEAIQANKQLTTLQAIVERLESERSKGAAQEEDRATRRALDLESENGELKTRLLALESRVEEQSEVLAAAKRLHEQLDRKEQIVRDLRAQGASSAQEKEQLHSRIRELTSSAEAKIDKELIRNVLLGYFSAPVSQRSDALRVIVALLGFHKDDLLRLGLKQQSAVQEESRWLGWFRGSASATSAIHTQQKAEQASLDASFTQSFVKFLERESTPTPVFKLPTPTPTPASAASNFQISPTLPSTTSTLPVQVPLQHGAGTNVGDSSEANSSSNSTAQPLVIPRSSIRGGFDEPLKLASNTSGFHSNSNPLLDVLQRHY